MGPPTDTEDSEDSVTRLGAALAGNHRRCIKKAIGFSTILSRATLALFIYGTISFKRITIILEFCPLKNKTVQIEISKKDLYLLSNSVQFF